MIPYGMHSIDDDDIQAVVDVLRSGSLTQGPMIAEFEAAFANYVGAKYAVAVSSCTAGLHLSALVSGMCPRDTLITSPITFVASANSGLYAGGNVAFADIDPTTINIQPSSLASILEENPRTKVVIPVHFGGLPCEMDSIKRICDQAGALIVEDAAHALGATYTNGQRVGSCCYSSMTVFSLHPVKAIAAGEGGVITTNEYEIYRRLLRLRSHGINKNDDSIIFTSEAFSSSRLNPWYYEMQELGFHYRITDIQCALAKSQLAKITKFIDKRRHIAEFYHANISNLRGVSPAQSPSLIGQSAHHLFVIRINFAEINMDRGELMYKLMDNGIGTQVHYVPVPMHPLYRRLGANMDNLQNALAYYRECLSIPIYYSLQQDQQSHILEVLHDIFD